MLNTLKFGFPALVTLVATMYYGDLAWDNLEASWSQEAEADKNLANALSAKTLEEKQKFEYWANKHEEASEVYFNRAMTYGVPAASIAASMLIGGTVALTQRLTEGQLKPRRR